MAKSACADSRAAVGVRLDVKNDVVRVRSISRTRLATRENRSNAEIVARPPSNHVIGAGHVAADPEAAHSHAALIERKAPAEHIDAADALADHRILRRAEGCGVDWRRITRAHPRLVAISDVGLDRIAVLAARRGFRPAEPPKRDWRRRARALLKACLRAAGSLS